MSLGDGPEPPDYEPTAEAHRYAANLEYQSAEKGRKLLVEQWKIDRELLEKERDRVHSRWERDREMFQPWVKAGTWAINALRQGVERGDFDMPDWVPPDATDWERSPGFEFRLQQAQEGIRRQGNIHGSAYSGRTLAALQRHGYNFARDDYDWARENSLQEYNQNQNIRNQRFNQLSSLAGQGGQLGTLPTAKYGSQNSSQMLNAAVMQARMGGNYATQMAQLGIQGAQARGAGAIGSANAMIQGQHAANAANQQQFDNTMTILGLGLGTWVGLGG